MTDTADRVTQLREHLGRDVPLVIMRADDLNEIATELRDLRARFEEQRTQLRDASNDLLNIRGILSPNGGPRAVPLAVQMVPNAAPAVKWLADDRDMYRDRWNAARSAADRWRKYALKYRDAPEPAEQAAWRVMAHALCVVLTALDGDEEDKPAAPVPPPGSYWTDHDGKVWDLSKDYEDRDGDRWSVIAEPTLRLRGIVDPLSRVDASFGPLTPVAPKVEPAPATDKPCHCYPRCAAEG